MISADISSVMSRSQNMADSLLTRAASNAAGIVPKVNTAAPPPRKPVGSGKEAFLKGTQEAEQMRDEADDILNKPTSSISQDLTEEVAVLNSRLINNVDNPAGLLAIMDEIFVGFGGAGVSGGKKKAIG